MTLHYYNSADLMNALVTDCLFVHEFHHFSIHPCSSFIDRVLISYRNGFDCYNGNDTMHVTVFMHGKGYTYNVTMDVFGEFVTWYHETDSIGMAYNRTIKGCNRI